MTSVLTRPGRALLFAGALVALGASGSWGAVRAGLSEGQLADPVAEADTIPIVGDTLFLGELGDGDIVMEGGAWVKRFDYQGRQGQSVMIVASSDHFRPMVVINDLEGGWREGARSRDGSQAAVLDLVLPRTTVYRITVSTQEAGVGGIFAFYLHEEAASRTSRSRPHGGWVFVGGTEESQFFRHPHSEREVRPGVREAWALIEFDELQPGLEPGEYYDVNMVLFEFDCPARRSRVTFVATYDGGRSLDARSLEGEPWSPVVPGSTAESFLKTVCPP